MANAEESTKAGLSRLQDDARPTICSDSLELISNIAEVGLDEILQNEFLKDIPVISSLVSIYKIGNNIHNAHLLKKFSQRMYGGCGIPLLQSGKSHFCRVIPAMENLP